MDYILAIDQGTTGCRAILVDRNGQNDCSCYKEFPQYFPHPGWVEHDPEEIWACQLAVMREVMDKGKVLPQQIKGIGITNQRETTVVWNRATGKPIYPAIVWQDRRTAPYCEELNKKGWQEAIAYKTGLRIDPYFSATKLRWILDAVPNAHEMAKKGELAFGTIDSWLMWNLTGGKKHLIEITNASRTLLFNIRDCVWDEELLQIFDIPKALLPQVCSSSEIYGETVEALFGAALPIAGCAGDQQAALFGQRCITPGAAKNTYGTGCFLLMHTGTSPVASKNQLLTTIASKIGSVTSYAIEGSVFIGGAVVQWLRDELKIVSSSQEIEGLAQSVSDNGGVYFVPAFSGLGAPYWNPYAKGSIFGLTRGTKRGHIARAALEAIAHQCADLIKAMEADSGLSISELKVDGGASQNSFLMQFQADILGRDIVRPHIWESTALGAAYLAGLSTGFWKSQEEINALWKLDRIFAPELSKEDVDKQMRLWKRAVACCQAFAID